MAAPQLSLDLSNIAIGKPRVPDPIATALALIQTTLNSLGNVHIADDAAIATAKLALAANLAVSGGRILFTDSTGTYYLFSGRAAIVTDGSNGYAQLALPIAVSTSLSCVTASILGTGYAGDVSQTSFPDTLTVQARCAGITSGTVQFIVIAHTA